jgi:prophage regulatory protein
MADRPIHFLRLPEILRRVPYSEAHIWRLEKAGKFPRRVRIGANRIAWVESEVNNWVSSKLQERDR